MLQDLINLDQRLFLIVNGKLTNSFFDWLMPFITDIRNTWWILLVLVSIWVFFKRGKTLKIVLGCVMAISISDQFNSHMIKNWVKRDRPPVALGEENVRLLTFRHSGYSFMSSHSANAFAAATYITMAEPLAAPLVFPIAIAIAYSRMYVGVHFPLDVTCGALLGALCALFVKFAFSQFQKSASKLKK